MISNTLVNDDNFEEDASPIKKRPRTNHNKRNPHWYEEKLEEYKEQGVKTIPYIMSGSRKIKQAYCSPCDKQFRTKSVKEFDDHVKSSKHRKKYWIWEDEKKTQLTLKDSFAMAREYSYGTSSSSSSSSSSDYAIRFQFVRSCLMSNINLNQVKGIQPYLPTALKCDRRELSNYIPTIRNAERDLLIREVSGKRVVIIFDGTSRS